MNARALLTLITCWVWSLSGSAQTEDAAQTGKYRFSTCSGCHAIPGYTNTYPMYHVPKLGGQHADYIVAALQAYKDGLRNHQTMHANASNLDAEAMQTIAAYLSTFQGDLEDPPIDGDPAAGKAKLDELKANDAAAACSTCHGDDGNSPQTGFPRLAGQYEDYLLHALKDYKSGARNNAIMKGVADKLSEQEMADLAAYYASQEPVLAVIEY